MTLSQNCPAVAACSDESDFPWVKWSLHLRPGSVPLRPGFRRNCRPPKDGMGFRIRCLGLLGGARKTFLDKCQQRCWGHKTANVLNCFPQPTQAKARTILHDIWRAEAKKKAAKAFDLFVKTLEDKYPKATASLQQDQTELRAFYDVPAAHWQSIRTPNPIESGIATIRHRTKRSKGCLRRKGMLHIMFKLGQ
ncbi:MAG: putative transposase [Yoonia sp.]|jgi:putative transposase